MELRKSQALNLVLLEYVQTMPKNIKVDNNIEITYDVKLVAFIVKNNERYKYL